MNAPLIAAKHTYCMDTTRTSPEEFDIDFGVADKKGRAVGASYSVYLTVFTPTTQEDLNRGFLGYDIEPGTHYSLHCQATRGGYGYGAAQAPRQFKTAELRQAAIHKYINAARKRAVKNFDFVGPVTQV